MIVFTARQLGAVIRDRRRTRGLTQSDVAAVAQVSRQSLAAVERGKTTAEVGLCLRVLDALELELNVAPRVEPDDPVDAATDQLNRAIERMRGQ